MPGYKGHLVGGSCVFACGLFALKSLSPSYATIAEWLLCTLAGSLFPDIDTKSKGQGIYYRLILCILLFLLTQGNMQLFIAMSIISLIPLLVRHRGLFHKLWFVTCFPAVVSLILSIQFPMFATIIYFDAFFFIVGAISHLLLDLGVRRMFRW